MSEPAVFINGDDELYRENHASRHWLDNMCPIHGALNIHDLRRVYESIDHQEVCSLLS